MKASTLWVCVLLSSACRDRLENSGPFPRLNLYDLCSQADYHTADFWKEHNGKVVETVGHFGQVRADRSGVMLWNQCNVQCVLPEEDVAKIESMDIKEGTRLRIRGRFRRGEFDIDLKPCRFLGVQPDESPF